jgi:hypothetical protein
VGNEIPMTDAATNEHQNDKAPRSQTEVNHLVFALSRAITCAVSLRANPIRAKVTHYGRKSGKPYEVTTETGAIHS